MQIKSIQYAYDNLSENDKKYLLLHTKGAFDGFMAFVEFPEKFCCDWKLLGGKTGWVLQAFSLLVEEDGDEDTRILFDSIDDTGYELDLKKEDVASVWTQVIEFIEISENTYELIDVLCTELGFNHV